MIVAIAGATGLTGRLSLERLLDNPRVTQVIAIGRRPTGLSHSKLNEVSLERGELKASPKVEAFLCCLGTTLKKAGSEESFAAIDLHLPLQIAGVLRENGCPTASVVSAMGADSKSKILYNRTKGLMEAGFRELGFSNLALLRPSLIEGTREEARPLEKLGLHLMNVVNPLLVGPLRHYRSISAACIADRLVHSILSPRSGLTIYLSGDIPNEFHSAPHSRD